MACRVFQRLALASARDGRRCERARDARCAIRGDAYNARWLSSTVFQDNCARGDWSMHAAVLDYDPRLHKQIVV